MFKKGVRPSYTPFVIVGLLLFSVLRVPNSINKRANKTRPYPVKLL